MHPTHPTSPILPSPNYAFSIKHDAWVDTQIRQLYGSLPVSLVVSLAIAALLVWLQWGVLTAREGLSWLIVMCIVLGGRTALAIAFVHDKSAPGMASEPWLRRYRIGVFLSGLAWGTGSVILFPSNDIPHQVILALAFGGLTAGAMTAMSIDRISAISFAAPTLVPLALRFALENNEMSLGMSAMTILFLVFEIASSKRAQLAHYDNVRLRTESEMAKNDVQELLSRVQKIAAQVPGMVFQFQLLPDGRSCFPYVSEGIRGIYRLEPEDVRKDASKALKLIHPDDFSGFMESITYSARSMRPWQREFRVRFANKDQRWISSSAAPQREKDGSTLWHGFASDMTVEKEARVAIEQFKSTLDRTLDCVFMFDAVNFRFFYANQGAFDQVGYDRDILLTMHPFDIEPDISEVQFRALIQPLIDGERNALTFETIHLHRDGSKIPVEVFLQYLAGKDESSRFVAIVRDITERKRVERLKSEFISTVSHELRTPLTSITGALGLVAGGATGAIPITAKPLIDIALQNSQRLTLLINDLLDMEKIADGKMRFDFQVHILAPLVSQAVEANLSYATQFRVKVNVVDHSNAVRVQIDPQRLTQIVANFLSNAIKFSPQESTVEIGIEQLKEWVRVSIRDHGPGIPIEFRKRIFQKFSQADSSDTRRVGGAGLGLAITKELVERMRGRVGFDSVVGAGACFYFEFPIIRAD